MPESLTATPLAQRREDWRRRALAARERPAPFGPDVDLSRFTAPKRKERLASLESLPPSAMDAVLSAGFEADEASRAGSFLQIDHSVVYDRVRRSYADRVEILSAADALARYDWVADLWWTAVAVDQDKYTARAELDFTDGYFIRVRRGQRIEEPLQACLVLSESNVSQNLHNLVVVEDGAEARIVTGCTRTCDVEEGLHVGVTEFYVGRGASLSFTMVHNWAEGLDVRPRTGVVLAEDANFASHYLLFRPVRSIQMHPSARLEGRRSRALFSNVLCGLGRSYIDVGSKVILSGAGTRAESNTRAVGRDRSTIVSRGEIAAYTNDCRGHLDCRGILFSPGARMVAIPELTSEGAPGAELSHEAAISPIAEEEVYYLMSRGLTREQATSTITRGFLNADLPDLSRPLVRRLEQVLYEAAREGM